MILAKPFGFAAICWSLVVLLLINASIVSGSEEKEADGDKVASAEEKSVALAKDVTQGALRIVGEDAKVVECPLKHTDVVADISGFIARVTIKQTFHNPTKEKIEAVYVFPLPHEAAVDNMSMEIGERKIVGVIKPRDQARYIYQQAVSRGQTAALLEQERPNIFTQSVGNIAPGQQVDIEISYVDVLKYDQGSYEFQFPMVVGPRYNPIGTNLPADANRLNPPVLKPGERTSHDISLTVNLEAGVPIQNLRNSNHKVHTLRKSESQVRIRLLQEDSQPNKDFLLRYDIAGEKPEMALLTHTGDYSGDAKALGNGYFMLMIQPKEDDRLKKSPPREVVFLVDVSGSMKGAPTEKVKDAMTNMLSLCRDQDTVQIVTFSNQSKQLFDKPVPTNKENLDRAMKFVATLQGNGGTEMLSGVKKAIEQPVDKDRVRIVVMLTDGKVGNESQIIEHVGKHCGDKIRFWVVAIGSSPNMFLAEGVSRHAGGMGKRLNLNDDAVALSIEVMTRIQRAQLTNVEIDWGELNVNETYPTRLPELWAGRPVVVFGRYSGAGDAKILVSGNVEDEEVSWPVVVTLREEQPDHDTLAKVWARKKIENVMQQSYYGGSPAVEESVTALALDYKLMSRYTSFVAVDPKELDKLDRPARPPRRMAIPVPLPAGTEYSGFFGQAEDAGVLLTGEKAEVKKLADVERIRILQAINGINRQQTSQSQLQQRIASYELAFRMQTRAAHLPSLAKSPTTLARRLSPTSAGALPMYQRASSAYFLQNFGKPNVAADAFGINRGGWRYTAGRGGRGTYGYDRSKQQLGQIKLLTDGLQREVQELHEWSVTAHLLGSQAKPLVETAQAALKSAGELQEKDDLKAARFELLRAILLDSAVANVGQSSGQVANQAISELTKVREKQVEQWTKELPTLNKKLNLVLRDKSLDAALREVASAADADIEFLAGSDKDSAALLQSDPRVTYLDLRGATVAQALDWIVHPAQLNWRVESDKIIAGSDRRTEDHSAWVYDVSALAVPSVKELQDLKDQKKAIESAQKAAEDFIKVARQRLHVIDGESVVWFGPGQLLVVANRKTHQLAAELLNDLADPNFKPDEATAKLHAVTSKRAADRKALLAELQDLRREVDVLSIVEYFSPRLLASASAGKLDEEALTELQIAWKDSAITKLLSGRAAPAAIRSLWMIRESSRALANQRELQQLAENSLHLADDAMTKALSALDKSSDDTLALASVVFAALAKHDDTNYRRKVLALFAKAKDANPMRTVAAALLVERAKIDRTALGKLVNAGVSGDDATLLLAIACHRAGGQLWKDFRAEARRLVGRQPLSGETVVLITRLPESRLASAVAN